MDLVEGALMLDWAIECRRELKCFTIRKLINNHTMVRNISKIKFTEQIAYNKQFT